MDDLHAFSMHVIKSPDFKPAAELETQTQESSLLFQELAEALAPHLLLVRLLGQGGMGLVYLARDPALKRLVAVKVLSPELARDDTARLRFARTAETMAAMSHPNIAQQLAAHAPCPTGKCMPLLSAGRCQLR